MLLRKHLQSFKKNLKRYPEMIITGFLRIVYDAVVSSCRFQNVLLVSVKFFPSLARAGLVEELRHLYVVVILWSGMCSLENLEVKF